MNFLNHTINSSEENMIDYQYDLIHKYFGVEKDGRVVRRFKLLFRTGKQISIPYAHLPIILLEHNELIYIKTNEISISIQGRALSALVKYLNIEQVRWIKESTSGIDNEDTSLFIENINVDWDFDL